ncbi:peptide deformylase [Schaalia vaccimaxillae]|uniref:peptide deformylase n=1 Tax=Schaalia vaccimaxillae TaxID=183916 RepID=UPI0003B550EE|nr:peptide deformylase [Schaalia vaccimaxillae]
MSILPIVITGDPVLHQRAQEIDVIDSSVADLAHDMIDTMVVAPGVGLAAPQVGVGQRLFVWRFSGQSAFDDLYGSTLGLRTPCAPSSGVVVNPQLEYKWDANAGLPAQLDEDRECEGCLSIPGYQYPLRRAGNVVLTGLSLRGQRIEIEAWGWLARIFQHEYDHLAGTLYVDRLDQPWKSASRQAIESEGWGRPGFQWTSKPRLLK